MPMPNPQESMEELEEILSKRNKTHGNANEQFFFAQDLKRRFEIQMAMCQKLPRDVDPIKWEALEMIFTKISRLASGDFNNYDSWLDIAGYATLASRSNFNPNYSTNYTKIPSEDKVKG